jgi:hypothetical protein
VKLGMGEVSLIYLYFVIRSRYRNITRFVKNLPFPNRSVRFGNRGPRLGNRSDW